MKKAFYLVLVLISMGFTTITIKEQAVERRKKTTSKAIQQGYLEVVAPQSYVLTVGG